MARATSLSVIPVSERIVETRGHKVILDSDLAALYGVTTKALNQAVKRNRARFPADFSFVITVAEVAGLRSQTVTANTGRGGRRTLPRVFTEHGAIMAASVLNSTRAVEMSVFVVRAFVRLRDMVRAHMEFGRKLDALERKVVSHDQDLKRVFAGLRKLLEPAPRPRRQIGFGARLHGNMVAARTTRDEGRQKKGTVPGGIVRVIPPGRPR